MQKKLTVGVIGLGVGERHLISLSKRSDVEVKLVCDLNPQKEATAKEINPKSRFTIYPEEVLNSDIDLVIIASFDSDHANQVIDALKNQKHVFVEKPLCLTREELSQIQRTAQQFPQNKISTNFVLRREPRMIELRRQITDGNLGEIYLLQASYDFGRFFKIQNGWRGKEKYHSAMLGGGIHMLDLSMWLLDQDFKPLKVFKSGLFSATEGVTFDDFEGCFGNFKEGATGFIFANYGSRTKHYHQLKIYGSKGTFVQDFGKSFYMFGDDRHAIIKEVNDNFPSVNKGEILDGFICYLLGKSNDFDILTNQVLHVMDRALNAIGK